MMYLLVKDGLPLSSAIVGVSEIDALKSYILYYGFSPCMLLKSDYDTLSGSVYVRRFSTSQLQKFIKRY